MITKMIKKWKNTYFKDFQCVAGSVLHNGSDLTQGQLSNWLCSAIDSRGLSKTRGWVAGNGSADYPVYFGIWGNSFASDSAPTVLPFPRLDPVITSCLNWSFSPHSVWTSLASKSENYFASSKTSLGLSCLQLTERGTECLPRCSLSGAHVTSRRCSIIFRVVCQACSRRVLWRLCRLESQIFQQEYKGKKVKPQSDTKRFWGWEGGRAKQKCGLSWEPDHGHHRFAFSCAKKCAGLLGNLHVLHIGTKSLKCTVWTRHVRNISRYRFWTKLARTGMPWSSLTVSGFVMNDSCMKELSQ